MSKSTTNEPVIIIGGGLAGLYSAYLLQQRNIPYLLLEAKPQLGGRIEAAHDTHNSAISFDLGPTWIFDHQPKIQQLISLLCLPVFAQYTQGDVLYQAAQTLKPQQIAGAGEMHLLRLTGGMYSLIKALYEQLNPASILTEHHVVKLHKQQNTWHITANHNGKIKQFSAKQLIAALPPRMITQHLTPDLWADQTLINRLTAVPTWMAGQAKFIATFEHAFWRDKNLSGQCFSRVGPLVEVHDASASHNGHPALFGFIGVPYSTRSTVSTEQLKQACIKQLAYFYGDEVYAATGYFTKDWAADPYVANENDKTGPSQHPEFNYSGLSSQLANLNIRFVGSEFAQQEAGYLEGAINAADTAINALKV